MQDELQQRLQAAKERLERSETARQFLRYGRLVRVTGLTLEVVGCRLVMGQRCLVSSATGQQLLAEVVGFNRDVAYLMPLEPMSGLFAGAKVLPVAGEGRIRVGHHLLGRVGDGLLQPLDGRPLGAGGELVSLFSAPPNP